MKKTATTIAVLVAAGIAQANVINLNISGNNPNDGTAYSAGLTPLAFTGTTWNDVGSDSAADLVDTDGLGTTIDYDFTYAPGGVGGVFSGGVAPGMGLNYRARCGDWGGGAATTPSTITFSGLDDATSYNFYFVCVGDKVGQGAAITYTGAGGGSGICLANDIYTMSEGNSYVKLSVANPVGGVAAFTMTENGVTNWQILGGVQIETVPEPATLGLVGAFGGAIMFIRRRLMI